MKMNIVCATDDHYAPYCGIMLTSLFENHKRDSFAVFVLTRGLGEASTQKLQELASIYHQTISFIIVDKDTFKDCPIRDYDHVTIETYFRIILPQIIPSDIHKILYLDVDLIVDGQIGELYQQDVNGIGLLAAPDLAIDEGIEERIDVNKGNYFNAGVLLINLDFWRDNDISKRCFEVIRKMADKLLLHDQDTLNVVFQNDKGWFDVKYNFNPLWLYKSIFQRFDSIVKQKVIDCANAPTIVHYADKKKPWQTPCSNPFSSYYFHYKSMSLWVKHPQLIQFTTIRQRMGWYRRVLAIRLGLMESWYATRPVSYRGTVKLYKTCAFQQQ